VYNICYIQFLLYPCAANHQEISRTIEALRVVAEALKLTYNTDQNVVRVFFYNRPYSIRALLIVSDIKAWCVLSC